MKEENLIGRWLKCINDTTWSVGDKYPKIGEYFQIEDTESNDFIVKGQYLLFSRITNGEFELMPIGFNPNKTELTSLPEKWCIRDCKEVSEYAHKKWNCDNFVGSNIFYESDKTYNFSSFIPSDYTEITFDQFKKWVLDKQQMSISPNDECLTQSQLIKGEIYSHYESDRSSRKLIGVYDYGYEWSNYVTFTNFSRGGHLSASVYFKRATSEERKWLEACIKANKFISKEEALKYDTKYVNDMTSINNSYKVTGSRMYTIADLKANKNLVVRCFEGAQVEKISSIFKTGVTGGALNNYKDICLYTNGGFDRTTDLIDKNGITIIEYNQVIFDDIKQGEGLLSQITFPTWYDSKMVKELFEYDYPLTGEECFKSNNLEFQQPVIIKNSSKKSKFKLIVIN